MSLSRNPAPVQRNASLFLHDTPLLCKSQWNSSETDTWHIHEKSLFRALTNGRAIGAGFEHLWTAVTVADGCEHENNVGRTQLYPQTPKLNENPSLRIREKKAWFTTVCMSAMFPFFLVFLSFFLSFGFYVSFMFSESFCQAPKPQAKRFAEPPLKPIEGRLMLQRPSMLPSQEHVPELLEIPAPEKASLRAMQVLITSITN